MGRFLAHLYIYIGHIESYFFDTIFPFFAQQGDVSTPRAQIESNDTSTCLATVVMYVY